MGNGFLDGTREGIRVVMLRNASAQFVRSVCICQFTPNRRLPKFRIPAGYRLTPYFPSYQNIQLFVKDTL